MPIPTTSTRTAAAAAAAETTTTATDISIGAHHFGEPIHGTYIDARRTRGTVATPGGMLEPSRRIILPRPRNLLPALPATGGERCPYRPAAMKKKMRITLAPMKWEEFGSGGKGGGDSLCYVRQTTLTSTALLLYGSEISCLRTALR